MNEQQQERESVCFSCISLDLPSEISLTLSLNRVFSTHTVIRWFTVSVSLTRLTSWARACRCNDLYPLSSSSMQSSCHSQLVKFPFCLYIGLYKYQNSLSLSVEDTLLGARERERERGSMWHGGDVLTVEICLANMHDNLKL